MVVLIFAAFGFTPSGAILSERQESPVLHVIVQGIDNAEGVVRIALWADANSYLDGQHRLRGDKQPASTGEVVFVFEGLPPGRYAMAAYHDANDNDQLDRTLIGLPAEKLGFSNGARLSLIGPPTFDRAAIEITPETAELRTAITLAF